MDLASFSISLFVKSIVGKIISHFMLVYEAKSLSDDEKEVLRTYDGSPNFKFTRMNGADDLIKRLAMLMYPKNRAGLSRKGEELKKIIEKYKI